MAIDSPQATFRSAARHAARSFDWRLLGFAFLMPLLEVFRRISFSLPLTLGSISSPRALIAALIAGTFATALGLLVASLRGRAPSLRAKAIGGIVGMATGFIGMAVVLAFPLPSAWAAVVGAASYCAMSIGVALSFFGWLQLYARVGSLMVALYVSVSIFIGNLSQVALIATNNPWAMLGLLAVCAAGSTSLLALSSARKSAQETAPSPAADAEKARGPRSDDDIHDETAGSETDQRTLRSIVTSSLTATAVGFALCFYPWGVMAIPPDSYAQDHSALVFFAGDLIAIAVLGLFAYSTRNSPRYSDVRQKTFFLLPAFTVFLAYFSFVRMLGLDAGGTLKTLLSIGYNASIAGFWALFATLAAMRQHERGMSVESACAPAVLLAAISYMLGAALHELYGNNAMYFLIVLTTLYILGLSVISTRKASLNDEERVRKNCEELAETCGLSAREAEILLLIAQDYSVDCIADQLVISIGTVRTHKKRIYAKVGVHKHEDLMRAIRAPQGRG